MTNDQYAQALRKLADIYERNPKLNLPHEGLMIRMAVFCHSRADFAYAIAAFGAGTKNAGAATLEFWPNGLDGLKLAVIGFRNGICERRVVGTRIIPERVVSGYVEPEYEQEIVEWHCAPFLDDGQSESL